MRIGTYSVNTYVFANMYVFTNWYILGISMYVFVANWYILDHMYVFANWYVFLIIFGHIQLVYDKYARMITIYIVSNQLLHIISYIAGCSSLPCTMITIIVNNPIQQLHTTCS